MAGVQQEPFPTDSPSEAHQSGPPSPPSQDAIEGSDQKISRKREREISLEPSTPRPDIDDDVTRVSSSGLRSPKKKNRTRLDTTKEEDVGTSRSRSHSRSRERPSPPHEVKVRQISQGVEDINWRQKKITDDVTPDDGKDEPAPSTSNGLDAGAMRPADKVSSSSAPDDTTTPASPAEVNAATTELPPECDMDKSEESSLTRRSSESDSADQEKGRKRKMADRAPSHGLDGTDALKTTGVEPSKCARDEDDNPRAKKRPTPPRTPEKTPPLDEAKRLTPPSTPPPRSETLPKPDSTTEAVKRPREDADKDDNPRQTKKPSPPPEKPHEKKEESVVTTPKPSGFMAYASTSSPFASVKGQNIFGGSKTSSFSKGPSPSPSPSPAAFSSFTSPFTSHASPLGDPSSSTSTATKRSGFEAFSGSTSPFASAARSRSPPAFGSGSALRSKSPSRRPTAAKNTSAFSSYAMGGAQAFAVPMSKRARAGSPEGASSSRSSLERTNSTLTVAESTKSDQEDEDDSRRDEGQLTFGEKLRAQRNSEETGSDDEAKPELTAQTVTTGEEDEKSVYMVRAKLFYLSEQNQWRERGTGTLKLNVRLSDGEGARIIMRKEAVFNLLLNVPLFHGMSVFAAQDPRYIRLSVIEGGKTVHYNVRVASAKIGEELLEAIKTYIPSAPA